MEEERKAAKADEAAALKEVLNLQIEKERVERTADELRAALEESELHRAPEVAEMLTSPPECHPVKLVVP